MSKRNDFHISREELLELCSKSINTVDGLWFVEVTSKFGFDAAMKLDRDVWRKAYLIHGRRVIHTFKIKKENPLEALLALVTSDPLKATWRCETEMVNRNKALLRRIACPPQEARLRAGRGTFPGDRICMAMYQSFADLIDPRINIKCLTSCAQHPEFWCEWQFKIKGNEDVSVG
jgi:hypothetical protein